MAKPVLDLAWAAALAAGACSASMAAPPIDGGDLRHHGAISRHTWSPGFLGTEVAGLRVSAGLALGLRNAVPSPSRVNAAPMLTLGVNGGWSLSILPGGGRRGTLLALQPTP